MVSTIIILYVIHSFDIRDSCIGNIVLCIRIYVITYKYNLIIIFSLDFVL